MLRWLLAGLAVAALIVTYAVARDDEVDRRAARAITPETHLRALQRIADANGGTRAAGTAGDRATGDYIAGRLRAAGYRVRTERFRVPVYRETGAPRLVVDGRRVRDVRTFQFSPSGRAAGRLRPIPDVGCRARDYAALQRGEIALVRRGDCFFVIKVALARRAGAAGVLVANDSDVPTPGSLFRPARGIPVLGVPKGFEGRRAVIRVQAQSGTSSTTNVIGEIGDADAPRVVIAGAHRDSVPAGPGLNDNGSGVVTLLTVADHLSADRLPPHSLLRLGFWGGEELGLLGSRFYVRGLPDAERRRIAAYINLDMVASPGAKVAVYDSDDRIEATLRRHLPPNAPEERLEGDSDHASFEAHAIPAGGLFTGLDDCYHQACDTIGNVDRAVLTTSTHATEAALLDLLAR